MIQQRLFALLLVGWQAYLIWDLRLTPVIPIVALALAAVGVPYWVRVPTRWWSWMLIVVVLALISWFGGPVWSPLITDIPSELWTLRIAEWMLLIQAAEMFRRRKDGLLSEYFVVWSMVLAYCTFDGTNEARTQGHFLIQAVVLLSSAALFCHASRAARLRLPRRPLLIRWAVALAVLIVMAWSTNPLADQWLQAAPPLRSWISRHLSLPVAAQNRRTMIGFTQVATLRSVTAEKTGDPMRVALRVYSDGPPGYLRGRAYQYYDGQRWRNSSTRRNSWDRNVSPLNRTPPRALPVSPEKNVFQIRESIGTPRTKMKIQADRSRARDDFFFLPLGTTHVQGYGNSVSLDQHNILRQGLRGTRPYTALVGQDVLFSKPTEREAYQMTVPPRALDSRVRTLAVRVAGNSQATSRDKIQAVQSFFRNNFSYSLESFAIPTGADPLSYFLLKRPNAHCEFFASGAVALLRLQKVPCRYVTGYVVTELEDEYGDYWVARSRDAHAWAEAYDADAGKWVIVEATPGMDLPTTADQGLVDDVAGSGGVADALSATLFEANWVRWLWSGDPLQMSFYGVAVAAFVGLLVRAGVRRWAHEETPDEARLAQLHQRLKSMTRWLQRRRLRRRPEETLHQFANRVRSADDDPWLVEAANWLLRYANVRYGAADADVLPEPPRPS